MIDLGPEEPTAEINVRNPRFYRRVALGGALGAADAYIDGDWDAPDLTATLRVLARNATALQQVERGVPRALRPLRSAVNRFRRNTAHGSRRNIAAHYDLSNEFFALMLDPTMTYSSGIFPSAHATLEEASVEKYDRLCRRLRIGPEHHVLEIGTGWGGFAEHAARTYGCRVTTTTISENQHSYAKQRFEEARVADRVELLQSDYRDLRGQYDRVVSIEMIEAVGEEYLPGYFRQCSGLLKPDGAMGLQAITIPDCRYERYRRSVDFIQRYIFPGGFLPSPSAITGCLAEQTDLRLMQQEDFSDHYARTLSEWRERLWGQLPKVHALGFDERFLRTWEYYLAYCEAGFRERQVGVSQWVLTKPLNRTVAGAPAA
ncbi:SAM-dependent methyltransferase [Posidoniimonas polymericola]|uniref:SAM-dependent methyltransferase n=1 Tax=Posidoniimonas polymericola TaxID=2528002 RepID=UPI0018D2AF70|nr:cyclopropane-fatty-acyl-phospholipid synthase family protein [Posidoniimonas polymericola]